MTPSVEALRRARPVRSAAMPGSSLLPVIGECSSFDVCLLLRAAEGLGQVASRAQPITAPHGAAQVYARPRPRLGIWMPPNRPRAPPTADTGSLPEADRR
jgi:hypothetical protein